MNNLISRSDPQCPLSARFARRPVAFTCVALLLLATSANAGTTVLQFAQVSASDTVTATDSGSGSPGTTTLATTGTTNGGNGESIYVQITNFLGTTETNLYAYETFVGVTSTDAATSFHGLVFENFAGTVEFTSGVNGTGTDYLTAAFAPMTLTSGTGVGGNGGGTSAFLTAAEPPDTLTLTSDYAILKNPTGMTLGFSNISPALSIDSSDNTLSSFTSQNSGTFSAGEVDAIPEPGSLFMASIATAIGALGYLTRRMKREG